MATRARPPAAPAASAAPAAPSAARRRWPYAGRGQKRLLGAALLALFGAFLPWVSTGVGTFAGVAGAGLWSGYVAVLGLAGAMVPVRRLAIAQAGLLAVVAVVLPVWQVAHLVRLVGLEGWLPGPGLVLTFGGGVLAAAATRSMLRREA